MEGLPKDIIKTYILTKLDGKDCRALWGTSKYMYSMYTPKGRMEKLLSGTYKGKRLCIWCGLMVFHDRYDVHQKRCSQNMSIDDSMCTLCDSRGRKPQILSTKNRSKMTKHPHISCDSCGKGITTISRGCLDCIFYCENRNCPHCTESFMACNQHLCTVPAERRWKTLLQSKQKYFGIQYNNRNLLYSNSRILSVTTTFGVNPVFVQWIMVDVSTYVFDPSVSNGTDVVFIVDKDAIDLIRKDLLWFHLGDASSDKRWVDYQKFLRNKSR